VPLAYENSQPHAGDPIVGCKHEPNPWDGSQSVHVFRFKRAVIFDGIESWGALKLDQPAHWFIACDACAKIVHEVAEREPARTMQAIGDLVGVGGIWPARMPILRLLVKETPE